MRRLKHAAASHPVIILMCGLGLVQVIATIQVYLSNPVADTSPFRRTISFPVAARNGEVGAPSF